jgi:hypothetical protein
MCSYCPLRRVEHKEETLLHLISVGQNVPWSRLAAGAWGRNSRNGKNQWTSTVLAFVYAF